MNWKSKYYLYYKILQFASENKLDINPNLEMLCKSKGWILIPYPREKLSILKSISKDGFTVKDGNDFYIMYNPELKKSCYERFRFTVAHEIGHIYLYHHIYVNNNVLMNCGDKNLIWEEQANIFAQNLLLPVKYKDFYKTNDLGATCNKFGVSKKMAVTRLNKMFVDELFTRKATNKIIRGD